MTLSRCPERLSRSLKLVFTVNRTWHQSVDSGGVFRIPQLPASFRAKHTAKRHLCSSLSRIRAGTHPRDTQLFLGTSYLEAEQWTWARKRCVVKAACNTCRWLVSQQISQLIFFFYLVASVFFEILKASVVIFKLCHFVGQGSFVLFPSFRTDGF